MIVSATQANIDELPNYDVIVVGGGAVGIVAAVDLVRRGIRVLLLEAGPQWVDGYSQGLFELAKSVGRKHRGLHQGRFRALGGTTNFWGGQLARPDSSAFGDRPWLANCDGWPITAQTLEPYYEKCEDLLEIPKDLRDDEAVCAYARIPDERNSEGLRYVLTRWLTEKNFRTRFRRDLERKEDILVLTEAPVVALRASEDGRTLDGVQIRNNNGRVIDLNGRFVILANGTIEIARLLMHPLADGRKAVWADNRWLGSGFMDHLEGTIGTVKPKNIKSFRALFDNLYIRGVKFQPRLTASEHTQNDERVLSFALHLRYEGANQQHLENAKIFLNGLLKGRFSGSVRQVPSHLWSMARIGVPMLLHYIANNRIFSPVDGRLKIQIMLEQSQQRESKVTLSEKTDVLGMRIPELAWAVAGPQEKRTVRTAVKYAKNYFESKGLADFAPDETIANAGQEVLDGFQDTYHQMGGARMAASEDDGVVDCNARVFPTRNLYIAGAAIFPSVGFANPTFTAMALALRLTDHIFGECGRP